MNKLNTRLSQAGMALLCLYVVLFCRDAFAQVVMERSTTSYSQNFDTLPATSDGVWENSTSYIDGWSVQRTKPGNAIVVSPGNLISGNLYSFGATGSADRALGAQSSANAGEFAWGVLLQNKTGGMVDFVTISFYGEQWRISNKTAGQHRTTFHYAVSSDKESFKLSPKSDAGWIPYPELDFKAPHYFTDGKALNGNSAANRTLLTAVLAVNIPDGHYLMLRWKDEDELEADHGLAIDDFQMSWSVQELNEPVVVLPVELAGFTARKQGAAIALSWLTASESHNDYFLIERSATGQHFESIGQAAGQGTKAVETRYEFLDEKPLAGTSYYRLKQVDDNGRYTYSAIVAVNRREQLAAASIYPTVTADYLQLDLNPGETRKTALVLDMMGKQLLQQPLAGATWQHTLDVRQLSTGTYLLVLLDERGQRQTVRFLKR